MPKIGITWGDQAGIGPEVIEQALDLGSWDESVDFVMVGERLSSSPGKPNIKTAEASLDALEKGAQMLISGDIDSIVTAPVAKEWLHKVGFNFPGQTEFFADRLQCENFAMCLTGPSLTVAIVTIHVALSEVPKLLSSAEIVRVGKLLKVFCEQKNKRTARIAVCGLNPHAGENGAFGMEDIEIISPAIEELNNEREGFFGPFPSDTVFRPTADGAYDAVLCMYHDQGLIPLKLLDFDTGVNTTLGLPKPRTSPDHGTAFDIAGKGIASYKSMEQAIKLAIQLC
jgi:4-hydroxythreonine-4-phosphate dehydrogenase